MHPSSRRAVFSWSLRQLGRDRHPRVCVGEHATAAACFTDALRMARKLGFRYGEATALNHLGDSRKAVGDLAGAVGASTR